MVNIRPEVPTDHADIHAVVVVAFHRCEEARLVDQLRADGDHVISLVALEAHRIVGHILLSRMIAPFPALGLAPVAVLPNRQRSGIGSRLVRAALESAGEAGWRGVFVLGDSNYYRRFGFDPLLAAGFTCRYSGPHFMALALGVALPVTDGLVEYPTAFRHLG
jgi:putative acetyltransferase